MSETPEQNPEEITQDEIVAEEAPEQVATETFDTTLSDIESSLSAQIEAILFVEGKPMSFNRLGKLLEVDPVVIEQTVNDMLEEYAAQQRGIRLVVAEKAVQFVTAPELHDVVAKVVKDDRTGELTKPSVETLAIIAYRGPVTKAEIEMIRGVNCTMILRNLLIRGLISERFSKTLGIEQYSITTDYLQMLGVSTTSELPNYEALSRDLKLDETINEMGASDDFFQSLEQSVELNSTPDNQVNNPSA